MRLFLPLTVTDTEASQWRNYFIIFGLRLVSHFASGSNVKILTSGQVWDLLPQTLFSLSTNLSTVKLIDVFVHKMSENTTTSIIFPEPEQHLQTSHLFNQQSKIPNCFTSDDMKSFSNTWRKVLQIWHTLSPELKNKLIRFWSKVKLPEKWLKEGFSGFLIHLQLIMI